MKFTKLQNITLFINYYMLLIGGNHELYVDSVVEYVQRPGGFIDWWGGRYLTSNIHKTSDGTPLGKRYKVLHGKNANVLVFGFIYSKCFRVVIFRDTFCISFLGHISRVRVGVCIVCSISNTLPYCLVEKIFHFVESIYRQTKI